MAEYELREQDKWLPIANVSRIMKNALPENAKISKEAKECMQECVSEFVSFITSEASEKCCAERRKTVNGEDILFAMMSLGFENYAEVLKIYLTKYRQAQSLKQEREHKQKQQRVAAEAAAAVDMVDDDGDDNLDIKPRINTAGGLTEMQIDNDNDDEELQSTAAIVVPGQDSDLPISTLDPSQIGFHATATANLHDIEDHHTIKHREGAAPSDMNINIGFDYSDYTRNGHTNSDGDGRGSSSSKVSAGASDDANDNEGDEEDPTNPNMVQYYDDYSPINGTYNNNVEMAPY